MTFIKGHKINLGKKRPGIGGVKKGNIPWNKGRKLSKKHIENLVKSHLGIKMPPRTIEHRKNIALANIGEKSHFWKGGISKENHILRKGIEFRLWRESVFKRDNFTCVWCRKSGTQLHPDHIKPWGYFPKLRFELNNGQTLCKDCHAWKTKMDMKIYFNRNTPKFNFV